MNIQKNKSLKNYNTFGIDVLANRFVDVSQLDALQKLLQTEKEIFVLGGGSNLLLTKDIEKLVVHINLKGINIVKEDEQHIYVRSMAGENWHDFVLHCVSKNYGGLENLSLIPGNVGTSPIQNIGAYGVELKDVFESLEAIEISTGKFRTFCAQDCKFGYRNSVFKNELKNQWIIVSVTFKLIKKQHQLNISYGAIHEHLKSEQPTIRDVSNAVIKIRSSKLPNPKEIGNSGSFFKNPIISRAHFEQLKNEHPNMPSFALAGSNLVKVPAAWLIDQLGFKGKRFGAYGVHDKQALVLVNHGGASGKDLLNLSLEIKQAIKKHYNIFLETEVNVV